MTPKECDPPHSYTRSRPNGQTSSKSFPISNALVLPASPTSLPGRLYPSLLAPANARSVTEVRNSLVDIDRAQRTVVLAEGILPYDLLVITAGLQDQTLRRIAQHQRSLPRGAGVDPDGLVTTPSPSLPEERR